MRKSIVRIACDLRSFAGEARPSFSTSAIIGASFPSVLVTGHELPLGVDELVSIGKTTTIFYRRGLQPSFQRLAIAHAIAHLIFDAPSNSSGPSEQAPGCPFSELRADEFACELLAPSALLLSEFPEHLLARDENDRSYLDALDSMASLFQVPRWVVRAQMTNDD